MIRFQTTTEELAKRIKPNVIYNRFDLFKDANSETIIYKDKEVEHYVQILYEGKNAKLGLYLMSIEPKVVEQIVQYVFKKRKQIERVSFQEGYCKLFSSIERNHFRIHLPDTIEELDARLSSKGRYNIRREKRVLEERVGRWRIEDIPVEYKEAEALMTEYFRMKYLTHARDYGMTWKEYCDYYHVTNIYSLTIECGKIIALILSCEQCEVVYIENLTYDTGYSSYSPGQILYNEYLHILIQKGFKEIFLLGGNYEYKRRYGSVEETVYSCTQKRKHRAKHVKLYVKRQIKRALNLLPNQVTDRLCSFYRRIRKL